MYTLKIQLIDDETGEVLAKEDTKDLGAGYVFIRRALELEEIKKKELVAQDKVEVLPF